MKLLAQPEQEFPDCVTLQGNGGLEASIYGQRAAKLARFMALGLPVPEAHAVSGRYMEQFGDDGVLPALDGLEGKKRLFALRSSAEKRAWGGAPAFLNIGIHDGSFPWLRQAYGDARACALYCGFIREFTSRVYDIHLEGPLDAPDNPDAVTRLLTQFSGLAGFEFPQTNVAQLTLAARSMWRVWNAPSARILRQSRGAPKAALMGLMIQEMVLPAGAGLNGVGQVQFASSSSGAPDALGQPPATDAQGGARSPMIALSDWGLPPDLVAQLHGYSRLVTLEYRDLFRFEIAFRDGEAFILDAAPMHRSSQAAIKIAVDLARNGTITRQTALLRIEPQSLLECIHTQVSPQAHKTLFGTGLAASPGAAVGRLVFTADDALAAQRQEEAVILVRAETGPEDIRGMHAAKGVLTIRGGLSSHAANIARGIGVPCVAGARELQLDHQARRLASPNGQVLCEGDLVTLDGSSGEIILGAVDLIVPRPDPALAELLTWADTFRAIDVRANADTPHEAALAREFGVDGLGLCRTEHMFFDGDRIPVMREMILARSDHTRRAALDQLYEMQRADFVRIFEIMRGLPVTIRLLDPPLHEFLPSGREELAACAEAMGRSVEDVVQRARNLAEVNPMLGMRGVRLGVMLPEIYDMQARAIFDAVVQLNKTEGMTITPEVMIPLVSANREVELIRDRIGAVAQDIRVASAYPLNYHLGIMVETPRAALRAGDLAASAAFLSFGTNDLTQMTYGLSRDDAGRFMRDYVAKAVFPEDPFLTLDFEGVGELLFLAAQRGRARNPLLALGLCGEHGGDPRSIQFCKQAGFDYVSCSPFRVPVARLAAAQASLLGEPTNTRDRGGAWR